jgi:uncharacterized protein YifE (UPF0438 family)
MDSKGEHLEYIAHKGLFNIDCDLIIFSKEEIEILEKWGHWFMALVSGELKPFTETQERFIKVMKREIDPNSDEERAWFKYLGKKTVEKKYGHRLKVKYQAEDDTFYSIEDKKKMNKITYSNMAQNHHKGLSEK